MAVPRMGLGENAATSLALVIHELATNSLKYGALSVDTGLLDISGRLVEDTAEIVWTEQGGPEVKAPSASEGYGSKLLQRTLAGQLGGSISYDWTKSGVQVTLRMKKAQLAW